jgi:hypothetical protein
MGGKGEEIPSNELIRLVQNGYRNASGPGFTRRLLLRRARGAKDGAKGEKDDRQPRGSSR